MMSSSTHAKGSGFNGPTNYCKYLRNKALDKLVHMPVFFFVGKLNLTRSLEFYLKDNYHMAKYWVFSPGGSLIYDERKEKNFWCIK